MNPVEVTIYILTQEEGGRTSPLFDKYRASFRFSGEVNHNDFILHIKESEMLEGGKCYDVFFEPVKVDLVKILLKKGAFFEVLEGRRLIAKGMVRDAKPHFTTRST